MYQKIENTIIQMKEHMDVLSYKQVTAGFDGFVDLTVHAVKSRDSQESYFIFHTIEEFASYLGSKSGKSGTIEIIEKITKIGGNMPIMSLALSRMGVKTTCVGAMGYPKLNESFIEMKKNNCRVISIGNPGQTIALEFDDGKIMLARMDVLQKITWKTVREHIVDDEMQALFRNCDMLALLNWSEMEHATELWKGILTEISQAECAQKKAMSILIWQIVLNEVQRIFKRYSLL